MSLLVDIAVIIATRNTDPTALGGATSAPTTAFELSTSGPSRFGSADK